MRRGFLKALLGIAAAPFVGRHLKRVGSLAECKVTPGTFIFADDTGELRRVVSVDEHVMTIDRAFSTGHDLAREVEARFGNGMQVSYSDRTHRFTVTPPLRLIASTPKPRLTGIFVLALLAAGLWPDRAQAQVCAAESWTLSPTGAECTTSNRGRLDANKETCARFNLNAGDTDATQCTQAQACGAPAIPGFPACAGGTGCTPAQAIACGRRIYPNSTAGREQWAGVDVVRPALASIEQRHAPPPPSGSDFRAYCLNFWIPASQVTRDGECTKSSLPPSCNICPLTF